MTNGMKKFSALIAALVLCIAAAAQGNTVNVGFCNGEAAADGDIEMSGKGWVSAAVKLPASALSAYVGNNVSAIRAAMVNRINIDTLRVWVRTALDGDNLASGTITRSTSPSVSRGWNEVTLDEAFPVTASTGDVYVGYSFHQRANVTAVSVVGDPIAGTSYLKTGDDAWQDISDKGVVSIEAVVTGDAMPGYDLGIVSATVSPWPQSGVNALRVTATLHNYGTQMVSGFTLRCTSGDVSCTSHIAGELAPAANLTCTFVIDPGVYTGSDAEWTVEIESLDGGTDENATNNTAEAVCSFLKNVFIEEFTTEQCVNCPRVAAYLHSALEAKDDYEGRVFAVCHHAGFYTDDFTQPCDEAMLWLYNNGSSYYAPAMMVNREPLFYTTSNTRTAVYLPSSADEITTHIDTYIEQSANAVLGVTCELNADSSALTASVTCLRNANLICPEPRLTVYLTEDDVKADYQEGYDGQYYHQHLIRAYNSTWGEPVTWDGNGFTYSYTFTLDSSWKLTDMQVLAVLSNYNDTDPTDCAVENSAQESVTGGTSTGISSVTAPASDAPAQYFNLSGQRIENPAHGIFIVRHADGRTEKVLKRR